MLRKSSSCFFLTCSSWQRCFWKIDATTTSRNTKQRQAKKKHITRHHVPYWAILSHIGPYDAPSLQQHNDASTLQWCSCCPWIQHASRFQLPWQTRMQRGTFASKLLQARYIPVLPEPESEKTARSLRMDLLLLLWKIYVTEALASSPPMPMQVTLWCRQQKGSTSNWTMAWISNVQSSVSWQSSWGLTSVPLIPKIAWHVYCIHCFSQVFSIFVLLFKCGHFSVYVHVLFLLCLGSVILLFQLLSLDAVELLLDGNTPGSKIISILFVRFQNLISHSSPGNSTTYARPGGLMLSFGLCICLLWALLLGTALPAVQQELPRDESVDSTRHWHP